MDNRSLYITGAVVLASAVCLHGYFFSRGFYSISWDESGRTLDAHAWAAYGTVQGKAWLPFYRQCVGLGLRAFPDLFLTPRIIAFLYGLATIPAAAWLAHELFQNRKTTLLTLILSAFFSQRVALSLAPLSDIMFIFMILITTAMFARWLRTYSRSALLLSALFGALASTVRYEGWIFNAAIFVIGAIYYLFTPIGLKRKDLLIFGVILFAFPMGWAMSTFTTTNPIAVVVSGARRYSLWEIVQKNPLVEFVLTNGFSLNLIGLISMVELTRCGAWRYKAFIGASFAPLVILSLAMLLLRSAQTGPSWRMVGVWGLLLVPFTARLLAGYSWPFSGGRTSNILASCATVLVLSAFMYDTVRIKRNSTWAFPYSDRLAGEYLNDFITVAPDTKILIESSKYFFLNIQVASEHPDAFIRNSVPEEQSVPILPLGSSIRDTLKTRGVTLLVFRDDRYKDFLDRSSEVAKLKAFGPWSIYMLTQ